MLSPFYVHFLCLATEYAFVIRQMEASAAELLDDELRYAIGHEHEEQHEQDDLQHKEDVHDGLRPADGSARLHIEDARDEARIVLFRSGVVMAALQGRRILSGRLRFLDAVFGVGEQIDRLVLDELFVAVEVTVMFAVVSDAAHLAVAVPLHAAVVMIGDSDVTLEMRGFERELRVDEICANASALGNGDGDVRVGAIGYVDDARRRTRTRACARSSSCACACARAGLGRRAALRCGCHGDARRGDERGNGDVFERCLQGSGEEAEKHEVDRARDDARDAVRRKMTDVLQPCQRECREAEEDGCVELDVGERDVEADHAEEEEEHDGAEDADNGHQIAEDEIENAASCTKRRVDDGSDDAHAFLHDLRRIGHGSLGCRRVAADEAAELREAIEREVADEVAPVVEEEEAEAVEETSPYDPRHESFLVLRWRREHLAPRAERDVDEAEDEEEACDAVLQEVESLCDDLDELVHDFLDGLCEVVRQRPILILAFKVCSTVGRDSSAKFGNEECGIDGRAARIANLEVAVRSRGVARRALPADELPRTDGLSRHDMNLGEMPVERRPAAFMLDDDSVAVAVDPARMCDDAGSGRDDGCIVVIRDVDARMKTACACDRMDAPAERR